MAADFLSSFVVDAAKAAQAAVADPAAAVAHYAVGDQLRVHVRTNLNAHAPLTFDVRAAPPTGPSRVGPVVRFFQPEVTIDLATGPVVLAPYGTPKGDGWAVLAGGAVVVVAALGVVARALPLAALAALGVGGALLAAQAATK